MLKRTVLVCRGRSWGRGDDVRRYRQVLRERLGAPNLSLQSSWVYIYIYQWIYIRDSVWKKNPQSFSTKFQKQKFRGNICIQTRVL